MFFAKEIYQSENFGYNENYIYLEGFLCKEPLKRTSPLGREICEYDACCKPHV